MKFQIQSLIYSNINQKSIKKNIKQNPEEENVEKKIVSSDFKRASKTEKCSLQLSIVYRNRKTQKSEQNNTQKATMESLINDLCGALLISLIEAS